MDTRETAASFAVFSLGSVFKDRKDPTSWAALAFQGNRVCMVSDCSQEACGFGTVRLHPISFPGVGPQRGSMLQILQTLFKEAKKEDT